MTKKEKQRVQLELHGNTLRYGRLGKLGQVQWAKSSWKIGRESYLPKALFFQFLTGYIFRRIARAEKSFNSLKGPITRGLFEAALALGCKVKFKTAHGDVVWYLNGHRFFAFQIHDLHRHRPDRLSALQDILRRHRPEFRKMERKSPALLRAAVVVLKGGGFKFVPGKTRIQKGK